MTNWTRAHDAHIARECEGWTLIESGDLAGMWKKPDLTVHHCPFYLTDPAAAIRAAEAWEGQVDGRGWSIESRRGFKTAKMATVPAHPNNFHIVSSDWHRSTAAALAQALYRATGGPA